MDRNSTSEDGVRDDIRQALEDSFPDGVVEALTGLEESYLADTYPRLQGALSRIEGATLLSERDPAGGPRWFDESDPDEDPPDWNEPGSSYCLFFIGSTDERLQFETEGTMTEEDGTERSLDGTGSAGCTVGVSLLAPFAVIALDDVEYYEDGSHTEPDIAPRVFDLDGKPRELDQHYQEMFEEEGLAALHDLRNRIAAALASLGIEVLGDDDLRKTVPWLKAGEDVAVEPATPGGGITVQDALFHREW